MVLSSNRLFSCLSTLEIGCGNGKLWENNTYNLRNREIFLSDISEGMLEDTRKNLVMIITILF